MSSADDFLFGGGTPSAKFPNVGDSITGVITRVLEPQQQRDYATGTPKTWDNGDPMMQLPIELATELRDPEITDDEGLRMLYVKGGLTTALRDAVKKAGSKTLEIGGTLTVTYARNGEPSKKGFNPPKQYDVKYTPPGVAASAEFLAADTPAASTPPAAAPPVDDAVETAKKLLAVGTPAATIAQVTGLDMAVIAALSQLVTA